MLDLNGPIAVVTGGGSGRGGRRGATARGATPRPSPGKNGGKSLVEKMPNREDECLNQPGPLLSGKTAVVTGAGSGIGRAIAATFSLHGAFVVCADQFVDRARETVDLVQGIGGQAVPMACDVQLIEELGNAVEKATGQTVRLDIMVKNAGVGTGPRNSFLDHDREDFERLASVNFLGVVQGCQWQSADSSSKAGAA